MNAKAQATSIDEDEIAKFSAMADQWWDEEGKFKPLHKFNPVRIAYIRDKICELFKRDALDMQPLKGLKILDIGCGGGLLSVPLTRLGAQMTAIDAGEENIKVAKSYAQEHDLEIDYRCMTAEKLVQSGDKYDVVLNMEVIEHVANVDLFMTASSELVKENGLMFVATINRTLKSYACAIIGAEYLLNWLPKGTHDWNRFLKPHQIEQYLRDNGLNLIDMTGVDYNILQDEFALSDDVAVNYIMLVKRPTSDN